MSPHRVRSLHHTLPGPGRVIAVNKHVMGPEQRCYPWLLTRQGQSRVLIANTRLRPNNIRVARCGRKNRGGVDRVHYIFSIFNYDVITNNANGAPLIPSSTKSMELYALILESPAMHDVATILALLNMILENIYQQYAKAICLCFRHAVAGCASQVEKAPN